MISTASEFAVWLAEMSGDRERVFNDWRASGCGMAVLSAGASWDAVRFPEAKGYRTYVDLLHATGSIGPMLWDSWRRHVYFLTSPGWSHLLGSLDVRVVSRGGWLAVPDPRLRVGRFVWIMGSANKRLTCPGRLYLSAMEAGATAPDDAEYCPGTGSRISPWESVATRCWASRIPWCSQSGMRRPDDGSMPG